MDYQFNTHCPNCFKSSSTSNCAACHFDRDAYLNQYAAAHHLPLFTVLEKGYVIGRVLGEGSFAIVYAGIREKDRLDCAIKEYYPRDLAQRGLDSKTVKPKHHQEQLNHWQNRFIQETELLRSCYDHPSVESGVVRYTALIKQHNTAYLVMERLSGMNLSSYLSQQKVLTPEQVCLWLKPLLETLQKLHAKEIYHRDISTNNIFLCSAEKPVLMDFGLAREGIRDELLKSSTLGAGTFIAPEQLTGGYCDERTDLYALGAVIYLCLHGEVPPSVEARRQGATLKSLDSADKTAQALQTAAIHCLQLNLNLRPKSAAHLLIDLTPFCSTQVSLLADPVATPALENRVPSRATLLPSAEPRPSEFSNFLDNPFSNPLPKPRSVVRSLVMFLCVLGALIGLAYAGLIAYLNYDDKENEQRKRDNLLFSQAKSIADYKTYLTACITCENQQRAMEKITQLELEQQTQLSQQKQHEQEALLFSAAQTTVDFKAYLDSCIQCADKPKAIEKLAEITEAARLADEQQLAEQQKEFAAALQNKDSSLAFYQQNCPKNLEFWQRTAEQGSAVAQLLLGSCYQSGEGVTQDYAETLKWYRKAAEQGNAYAQNNLGMMYQTGQGTERNEKEAAKWYIKAAEQGQAHAQQALGLMFQKGLGVTEDEKQAVDWFLRAAEQGNADAQYSLGGMYHYGSGVMQDYKAALLWYRKAADQGNDKAQYLLGIMYQNGYGVEADTQTAIRWYQKAADQGNADAVAEMRTMELMRTATESAKPPEVFGNDPFQ